MSTKNIKNKITLKVKFHRILGQVNFNFLNILCKEKLVEGISKWDTKASMGILVSCKKVLYRVLIDNKVIVTRHFEFIENGEELIGFRGDTDENESIYTDTEQSENFQCEKYQI